MRYLIKVFLILFLSTGITYTQNNNGRVRHMTDTVGFASKSYQMDAFMRYISEKEMNSVSLALKNAGADEYTEWKSVICPHDDYSYVGYLYPALLGNIKAKTVILIGVSHKAKLFNLENKIIFDSFAYWKMPYGSVKVSGLREEMIKYLSNDVYVVNDSAQASEHSVEAIIPFLQYYNRDVEIVSILVPYMPFDRMNEIAGNLSDALYRISTTGKLAWGSDFAIVISNDAVHYGDEDWGGKNYAPFGSDTAGYNQAVGHEYEIIDNCLAGEIQIPKIKTFNGYTVNENNYRDYKWTWCGRYSVPFGLLTSYYLQKNTGENLNGYVLKYATSIDHPHVPVQEFGMGVTAPANLRHWVGYAAIGYR